MLKCFFLSVGIRIKSWFETLSIRIVSRSTRPLDADHGLVVTDLNIDEGKEDKWE